MLIYGHYTHLQQLAYILNIGGDQTILGLESQM